MKTGWHKQESNCVHKKFLLYSIHTSMHNMPIHPNGIPSSLNTRFTRISMLFLYNPSTWQTLSNSKFFPVTSLLSHGNTWHSKLDQEMREMCSINYTQSTTTTLQPLGTHTHTHTHTHNTHASTQEWRLL